jgi:hypothetical protein
VRHLRDRVGWGLAGMYLAFGLAVMLFVAFKTGDLP